MTIEIKYLMKPGAEDLAPARAHEHDAAYDLRAAADAVLVPGTPVLVATGLFMELPPGTEAQVRPRSGLALKHGISVLNSPGTIDAGYRGEVSVILYNTGHKPYPVKRGERIAQMVVQQLPDVRLVAAPDLTVSDRGAGGFGSTGTS